MFKQLRLDTVKYLRTKKIPALVGERAGIRALRESEDYLPALAGGVPMLCGIGIPPI